MTDTQKYFAAVFLVSRLISAAPKQQNWWVDSAPMHRGTSAWQPYRQYSSDVEQGLAILATEEPAEVNYFRSRGYPIVFVPGVPGKMAQTTPLGVIQIPYRFEGQPAQLPVLLSHEIVHEQRHDPITNPPKYPVWRRLLWHQEEEVAHNKDLWVAFRLRNRYPSVWNILGGGWYLEPFISWIVGPFLLLDLSCLLLLAFSIRKGVFRLFASHSTQRQTT